MSDGAVQGSTIARILVEEEAISEQSLAYAQRIRSKLEEERPLLDILKELGAVDEKRVHDVLATRRMEIPLGELLVEFGHIAAADLAEALEIQGSSPDPKPRLGEVLVDQRFIADRELAEALAFQLGLDHLEPDFKDLDRALIAAAPPSWLSQHEFVPIERRADKVVVAFADPMDEDRIAAAETVFGKHQVTPAIASRGWVRGVVELLNAGGARKSGDPDQSAAVGIIDEMITQALEREASDIHIEPGPDRLRIRFREDGVLVQYRDFPRDLAASISSRIKVLCSADIAEKRRHQDGRFVHETGDHRLDLRVSIYVTVHGEKIVLRLLNTERRLVPIQEIGMAPRMIERFIDEALERPSGVILVTGPTGSGKTSTLYSCINYINRPETSIITAEDPVEYVMEGVGQCSLNPAIDLTYEET
ncbi:MAG: GspE/PulE family protein, partial [Myxococcota bacterium]